MTKSQPLSKHNVIPQEALDFLGFAAQTSSKVSCTVCFHLQVRLKYSKRVNMDRDTGNLQLVEAAGSGDDTRIASLLTTGMNFEYRDMALQVALEKGHTKCAELLAQPGDDVCEMAGRNCVHNNKRRKRVNSALNKPLLKAAMKGSSAEIEMLIQQGADVNALDNAGGTSLMLAARSGSCRGVKLLLEAGADFDIKDKNNITALMAAAQRGYSKCVEALTNAGADVNVTNPLGGPALVQAIFSDNFECVRWILEAGAEIFNCDNHQQYAVKTHVQNNGITPMAMLLYVAGVNVEVVSLVQNQNSTQSRGYTSGNTSYPHSLHGRTGSYFQYWGMNPRPTQPSVAVGNSQQPAGGLGNIPSFQQPWSQTVSTSNPQTVQQQMVSNGNPHTHQHQALDPSMRSPSQRLQNLRQLIRQRQAMQPPVPPRSNNNGNSNTDPPSSTPSKSDLKRLQLNLKHMCRVAIREQVKKADRLNLFYRIDLLPLPPLMNKYLMFNVALDREIDEESKTDIEFAIRLSTAATATNACEGEDDTSSK